MKMACFPNMQEMFQFLKANFSSVKGDGLYDTA